MASCNLHQVAVGRHFRVQRDHPAARAVVVHDQVVHPANLGAFADDLLDALDERRVGGVAQQRADRVARGRSSPPAGSAPRRPRRRRRRCSSRETAPRATRRARPAWPRRRSGCRSPWRAWRRTESCGRRRNCRPPCTASPPPAAARIAQETALKPTGSGAKIWPIELRARVEAHHQNQHRHDQPGHVLRPAVAERVLGVVALAGEPEARQRDRRGERVGEVVECVPPSRRSSRSPPRRTPSRRTAAR